MQLRLFSTFILCALLTLIGCSSSDSGSSSGGGGGSSSVANEAGNLSNLPDIDIGEWVVNGLNNEVSSSKLAAKSSESLGPVGAPSHAVCEVFRATGEVRKQFDQIAIEKCYLEAIAQAGADFPDSAGTDYFSLTFDSDPNDPSNEEGGIRLKLANEGDETYKLWLCDDEGSGTYTNSHYSTFKSETDGGVTGGFQQAYSGGFGTFAMNMNVDLDAKGFDDGGKGTFGGCFTFDDDFGSGYSSISLLANGADRINELLIADQWEFQANPDDPMAGGGSFGARLYGKISDTAGCAKINVENSFPKFEDQFCVDSGYLDGCCIDFDDGTVSAPDPVSDDCANNIIGTDCADISAPVVDAVLGTFPRFTTVEDSAGAFFTEADAATLPAVGTCATDQLTWDCNGEFVAIDPLLIDFTACDAMEQALFADDDQFYDLCFRLDQKYYDDNPPI